jgi:hypothetical protein
MIFKTAGSISQTQENSEWFLLMHARQGPNGVGAGGVDSNGLTWCCCTSRPQSCPLFMLDTLELGTVAPTLYESARSPNKLLSCPGWRHLLPVRNSPFGFLLHGTCVTRAIKSALSAPGTLAS